MELRYLTDNTLPPLGEWTDDQFLDPLHPTHGPLPDLCGCVEALLGPGEICLYEVSLWDIRSAIITQVCRTDEESSDLEDPMLSIRDAHAAGGWFPRSLRWAHEHGRFYCGPASVPVPEYPGAERELTWRLKIYRSLMIESVGLTISSALGPEVRVIFNRLLDLVGK